MDNLPLEVINAILTRLDTLKDLEPLSLVNQRMASACSGIPGKALWGVLLKTTAADHNRGYNCCDLKVSGACFACLSLYKSINEQGTLPFKVRAWLFRRARETPCSSHNSAENWAAHVWKLVDVENGDPNIFERVKCWCPGGSCLDIGMCREWTEGRRNLWHDHMHGGVPPLYAAGWEYILSRNGVKRSVVAR